MRYLSGTDLHDLVTPTVLVAAIEEALRDYAAGKVLVPARHHLDIGESTMLTMPVAGVGAFGAKVVSIVPSNARRGAPVVNGLMVLCDSTTGMPVAILDAAALTAQRTGAVGAVGLRYTTPEDVDRIGVVGVGVQGIWQAIFACAVRRIRTVYFVARADDKARRFICAVSEHVPSVRFVRCRDVEELLRSVDVVITATTSSAPVLPAEPALLENKHFIGVGSFKPSMQELPSEVCTLAQHIVVDSDAAVFEVGDLIVPLAAGVLRPANVVHLADYVTGRRSVDTGRTTMFKSVGMALYDLYVAHAFDAAARDCGRGTPLPA